MFKARSAEGLVVLEVLVENSSGGPPSSIDLKNWIKAYAVTFAVLADRDKSVFRLYVPETVLPTYLVIGRDGVIVYRSQGTTDDPTAEDKLDTAIDAALRATAK